MPPYLQLYASVKSFTESSDRTDRVNTSWIIGSNSTFSLSWSASPTAGCGYVVDWCPTSGHCKVEWLKVPPNQTNAIISSSKSLPTKQLHLCNITFPDAAIHLFCYFSTTESFIEGVRYSLSVYACTQGAPVLLERREGYVSEKSKIESFDCSVAHFVQQCFTRVMLLPGIEDGLFKSLKWKQQDSDVEVFWDPINPREQSAFIQGYVLYCSGVNNDIDVNVSTGNVTPSYFLMMGHKLCYEGYTVHSVSHLLNLLHK